MKKTILLLALASLLSAPMLLAQEQANVYPPQKGDFRIGAGWGWALLLFQHEQEGNSTFYVNPGHTKPVTPISVSADYTFMDFADGKGTLAAGALFEWTHYQTWSTSNSVAQLAGLSTFKTTITWDQAILAATATARYCFWQDLYAYAQAHVGFDMNLGYKEEYSDESVNIPHTNGPGNSLSYGIAAGVGVPASEHLIMDIYAALGRYTTVGLTLNYKF